MIEEWRESEAGEIEQGGKGTPWLKKKELKMERKGIRKAEIVQEKREQQRETDVTSTE